MNKGLLSVIVFLLFFWVIAPASAAEVKNFTTAEGLPSNMVSALAPGANDRLWVGTADAGLYLLDLATGKGRGFREKDGLASDGVVSIVSFRGKVYVGTTEGLSVHDGNGWTTTREVEKVILRNVRLGVSPDGKELWVSSVDLAGGLLRYDGAAWKFMGGEGRGIFNNINGFAFSREGVLLGAGSGAVYLHKGSDVVRLKEGLPPVTVYSVAARDGKWLAGTSEGLFEHDGVWKAVPVPPGISGLPVSSIAVKGKDVVAGTTGGVFKVSGKGVATLTKSDGLADQDIGPIAVLGDVLAVGTSRGLSIVKGW